MPNDAIHAVAVICIEAGILAAKAAKDLKQAAALLAFLREQRAWEVDEAWEDLVSRGKGWRTRAARGHATLTKAAPELDLTAWLPLPG